jgi:mono/diheme cytochrome c family protein
MKRSPVITAALVGLSLFCAINAAMAQGKFDFGKREYDSNCAGCHGIKGHGDGPYNPYLTKSSSDLSAIAKKNGGVFPYQRLYEVIDGRQAVALHGPRDMPIWGADYLAKAAGDYMDVPYDAEVYVRNRVAALLDYISRLQVK